MGKNSPDAVMAEICWRVKNIFQDPEFHGPKEQMEVKEEEDEEFLECCEFSDSSDSENEN